MARIYSVRSDDGKTFIENISKRVREKSHEAFSCLKALLLRAMQ